MNRSLLRIVALHLLSTPAMQNLLDWRFGLKLLRDNRVPVRSKMGAFVLGFIAFLALEILQLPVQTAMWALLSVAGIVLDFALDGVEFLVVSSIVGLLALQFTTPKEIVAQIRGNKSRFDNVDQSGRVYDVAGAKTS
jgi:hypothetical protein